jgi:hypothetical protein
MSTTTTRTANGYDVTLDGLYIGYLRRPTGNVFASDSSRYWDAHNPEGEKRGTGRNLLEAADILARHARHLGAIH